MTSAKNAQTSPAPSSQCAHPGCRCSVAPGQKYCGNYCENMIGADTCNCGHAECKAPEQNAR
jgi:hypothetical protein